MKKNPFEIKKSPCEVIAVQALSLDDYMKGIYDNPNGHGNGQPSCSSGFGI
jgi:hypothetical protein